MATVRIERRSQKAFTLIIDHGIDPVSKKRKKETRTLATDDITVAEAERLTILAELAKGTYKPTSKATIEEYFDYWFETPAAKKLDPKTLLHYKTLYKPRIKPWLGKTKIADLARDDLHKFYDRIIEVGHMDNLKPQNDKPFKPISKTTIQHYHRLIRRVLNHALLEDEIITKNVANRIALPEPEKDIDYDPDDELVKVLSKDEIVKLEDAAANSPHGNLVAVALRTGMRREELLALTWDCIDEKEGTIFIKKALSWTTATGYRVKPTKNKQKRKIEATPEVFAAFARQSKLLAAHKLRLGEHYRKDLNLVFCSEIGHYYHPNMPTRWFPKFCEDIGITRFTFHCLRHTHASHLLASGEDISFVSRRLGHSDIKITYNTYFHLIPQEKRKALEEFENRIKK